MAHVSTTVDRISFHFKVENVSQLKKVRSPKFTVHGDPWQVQIGKGNWNGRQSLSAFLYCVKKDKTPNLTHAAFATIKLVSSYAHVQAVEYSTIPSVFDSTDIAFGTTCLINWDKLTNIQRGYVKDDAIVLNIEIEVADPNELKASNLICANVEKCCGELCWSTFRLTIGNIMNLMAVRSEEFKMRNLPFRFIAYKSHDKHLGLRLEAFWSSDTSCEIQLTVKLISAKVEKNIKREESEIIEKCSSLNVDNIAHWNALMSPKNGYVTDDAIVMEVEIKASHPEGHHSSDTDIGTADVKRAKMECPICLDSIFQKTMSFVPCGHIFCTTCITEVIQAAKKCPTCDKAANLNDVRPAFLPITNWA